MKFIRRNRLLIIFFILCLITSYAIGRAGGGGGHGGGGGSHSSSSPRNGGSEDFSPLVIFLLAGWGIYSLVTSVMLFKRSEETNRLLEKIGLSDSMWNPEFLKEHAKSSFYQLQVAWQEKNMNKVKQIVTAGLYKNYTEQLNEMRLRKETNYISNITIFDIKIISCQDYKDNAKDRYVAHIKGNLLDYTLGEHNSLIKNPRKENEDFEDAYYFIRSGNKWMLEDINNDPGFWQMANMDSHVET